MKCVVNTGRLLALRYVAVIIGLVAMHLVLATLPEGDMNMFSVGATLLMLLGLGNLVLLFSMFWRLHECGSGPLWAGVVGCCISLYVLKQESGASPNMPVLMGFLGLLVVPALLKAIIRSIKRWRA